MQLSEIQQRWLRLPHGLRKQMPVVLPLQTGVSAIHQVMEREQGAACLTPVICDVFAAIAPAGSSGVAPCNCFVKADPFKGQNKALPA
jgi:hypothetical protein